MNQLQKHLTFLYGGDESARLFEQTQQIIEKYRQKIKPSSDSLTERDSILITYGDQVQKENQKPLQTLKIFCDQYLSDIVEGIHILPFYPWTSDDGFSVVDYRLIDKKLGDWEDVSALQTNFKLMFDAVINHISSKSEWFQKFLQADSNYQNYFITIEGSPDLSQVVRPRALPLLTSFTTSAGEKKVWTTFSADQIDLNYKNPQVLLEILDILCLYVQHGATFIRLDAIAYMWKEIGTSCIHLPQTHAIIQFLREALNQIAPHVNLITETNVPHIDNISYFGNGTNEAQLVYNFALPPLTLHTFHTEDATVLSNWAKTLTLPSDKTTFFNFLASHDGVGLNPARGILSNAEIDSLVEKTLAHGGLISYKNNSDGSQSPYEMNINYFDALSNPSLSPRTATKATTTKATTTKATTLHSPSSASEEDINIQVSRFICAQAIMLSIIGVPAIYFHSLFGSRNWHEGVKQTGHNRTINRQKCSFDELQKELQNESSLRAKVFKKYSALLKARRSSPAFHPHGAQKILEFHKSIFAVERIAPNEKLSVVCLYNISSQKISFSTNFESAFDLLNNQTVQISNLSLEPYQVMWAKRNITAE
ncbi:MAG: putative sucrose phosphorylase [Chloroflexi bacterium OLB14]|nr:MAG: putative sucrose phosphorylase [Chloroflexi bacterium OLB14]